MHDSSPTPKTTESNIFDCCILLLAFYYLFCCAAATGVSSQRGPPTSREQTGCYLSGNFVCHQVSQILIPAAWRVQRRLALDQRYAGAMQYSSLAVRVDYKVNLRVTTMPNRDCKPDLRSIKFRCSL